MIIDKSTPSGGYSQIPNVTARDMTVSRRALGLLVEILSYPSGTETNADTFTAKGREGRDATRKAMAELKAAGYVVEIKYRNEDGQCRKQTFASHTPEITKGLAEAWEKERAHQPAARKPSSDRRTGNQASVDQASGNQVSVSRASADQALLEKKVGKSAQKTEEKMRPQKPAATTEDQEPHMHVRTRDPEPPDLAPAWAAPADEPDPEDPLPVEDPPVRPGDCPECGIPLADPLHDVFLHAIMTGDPKEEGRKFAGRAPRPAESTP